MKKLSIKGQKVDFAYYMERHAEQAAIGNAMLNARGDQLDARGNVVKTRAEISSEYHRSTRSVKQVAIKALDTEVFQTPAEAVKQLMDAQAAKAAAEDKADAKPAHKHGRKLTDAE